MVGKLTFIRRQKCSPASRSKRANSSFRRRISSSAVHWADNDVKPHMSANKMLKKEEINYNHINYKPPKFHSVLSIEKIFWTYLTFSWRWMYILWNCLSIGFPAISAFISIATCRGRTDNSSLSWNIKRCEHIRTLHQTKIWYCCKLRICFRSDVKLYLLLIFSLCCKPCFYALPCLHKCLSLGNFTRIMS